MILKVIKKILIIFSLLGIAFFQCPFGDPQTGLDIYNNRNDNISVYYMHIFDKRDGIPEGKLDVQNGEMDGIGKSGLYEPLSKTVSYLIVRNSNEIELMNLRGSSLDNAVKLVSKDEDHILYRLDVN